MTGNIQGKCLMFSISQSLSALYFRPDLVSAVAICAVQTVQSSWILAGKWEAESSLGAAKLPADMKVGPPYPVPTVHPKL